MKMLNLMFLCLANINAFAAISQEPKNPTLPELQQSQPINIPLAPSTTVTNQPINPLNYALQTRIISGKYELDIASSLPQTGEVAIIGDHLATGMQAFLLKLKTLPNFNFYIKFDVRDDGGNITKTVDNINILNKKTPLFISLFGSNTMRCLIPYFKKNKLVSIFPIEGLEKWRTPSNKSTIFFRASYKAQVTALIDYSINSLHKKRFSVFYEASEWGEGVLAEIKNVLSERKLELLAYGSYPQKTVSVLRAVKKLSESEKDPDAILCIAQARPAYNFIQHMINSGFTKASFLCIDGLFSIQETLTKSRGITIVTTSVVPDPFKSPLPIAKEYRADMKKYFPNKNLSPFSFESYINSTILCECIKASQFPISANKLLNTIENIKNFDIPLLKDLNLNFNPETRTLSNRIWINAGDGKEWEEWSFNIERI